MHPNPAAAQAMTDWLAFGDIEGIAEGADDFGVWRGIPEGFAWGYDLLASSQLVYDTTRNALSKSYPFLKSHRSATAVVNSYRQYVNGAPDRWQKS